MNENEKEQTPIETEKSIPEAPPQDSEVFDEENEDDEDEDDDEDLDEE